MRASSIATRIFRRLAGSRSNSSPALRRELRALRQHPRFEPLHCRIGEFELDVPDGPSAAAQYEYIFRQECYDFPTSEAAPVILDCGANLGLGVLYWKTRYPGARITAFEADPYIFDFLTRNCRRWILDGVTLVNRALWTTEGTLGFCPNKADGGHVAEQPETGGTVRVACTRLAPYLSERVALLKMDIEGAEVDVLEDCRDQLVNVDRIFVEYHAFVGAPQTLDRLLRLLSASGFRYYLHPELSSPTPFRRIEAHNGKDLRVNVFAVRPS